MLSAGTFEVLYQLVVSTNGLVSNQIDFDPLIHRCLGCIHILLMGPEQRDAISADKYPGLVTLIGSFLIEHNVNFQREACGILAEIAQVHSSLFLLILQSYSLRCQTTERWCCSIPTR